MATKLVITPQGARAVYDDRWRTIYAALGTPEITRASEVEYNHAAQVWEATERATGQVIAAGPVRAEVIRGEIEHLEAKL